VVTRRSGWLTAGLAFVWFVALAVVAIVLVTVYMAAR
jgi:hypothetical protein